MIIILYIFLLLLGLIIVSRVKTLLFLRKNVELIIFDKEGIIEEKCVTKSRLEMPCVIVRCTDAQDNGHPYHIHIPDYKFFDKLEIGQKINFKLEKRMNKKSGEMYSYTRAYIE